MKDPVRLVEDREAPTAVRDLLRAARSPEPTEAQRSALWGAIAGAIGPGPGGPDGGGPDGGGGDPGGSIDPGGGLDLGASLGPAASGSVPSAVSSASSGAVAVGSVATSSAATTALGAKVVGAKLVGAKVVGSAAATWLGLAVAAGLSVGTAVMVGGAERPAPVAAPAAIVDRPAADVGMDRTAREPGDAPRPSSAEVPAARAAESHVAPAGEAHVAPAGEAATARVDEAATARADEAATVPGGRRGGAGAGPDAEPSRRSVEPVDAAATSPAPATSAAREEVAVTTRARQLIHAGEPGRALAELEAARVRFSGGVLVQERAALTVEALGRSGQHERAASLARAFLASWPSSTHAGLVRPWAK